jgi:hypothetical protein
MIKSRRPRWAGHVAHRKTRSAYKVLLGKPERKRPLGMPSHRWMDKINIDLKYIVKAVGWIRMVSDVG